MAAGLQGGSDHFLFFRMLGKPSWAPGSSFGPKLRTSLPVADRSFRTRMYGTWSGPPSLPLDLESGGPHPHVGRLLAGEDADRREAAPEHAGEAPTDHQPQLAGRLRIEEGEQHGVSACRAHPKRHRHAGNLARREPGRSGELEERLHGGIDPDLGIVLEND